MAYEFPEWFDQVTIETFEKMINVNMLSLVKVCSAKIFMLFFTIFRFCVLFNYI